MKGPYERLKYDLRRLWECPVCKRRERAAGGVTFKHCLCRMQQLDGQPVVMKLIEDGVQRLAPPVVLRHEVVEVVPSAAEDPLNGSAGETLVAQGPEPAGAPVPEAEAPQGTDR